MQHSNEAPETAAQGQSGGKSNSIPRLSFEELEPALARVLEPRYRRLGYLGEFFRCMGHQPAALRAFAEFTETAKAGLDKRTTEVIALTVATATGNAYERNQHERLCVRSGFSIEWIRDIEALHPEHAQQLSSADREVQRWVLAVAQRRFAEARQFYATFVEQVGAPTAVAALFVVGRYIAHSAMVQTLQLSPPVPSIFEDGFTGD
jgi:alkylhydroperoxidase/carboxymuconolactone decarboxylase family protein YurZ